MKPVTFKEVLASYGKEFADKALGFGWHHTSQDGEPFWTEDEFNDICGLIERECASENQG